MDKTWDKPPPTCTPYCPKPVVENAVVSSDQGFPAAEGQTVTVTCNQGHTLEGQPTKKEMSSQCKAVPPAGKRRWIPDIPPRCVPEIIIDPMCNKPTNSVANGHIVENHQYPVPSGTKVTYKCKDGYTMSGNNSITCNGPDWTSMGQNPAKCTKDDGGGGDGEEIQQVCPPDDPPTETPEGGGCQGMKTERVCVEWHPKWNCNDWVFKEWRERQVDCP
eukprot:TRINITY_DN57145_c0_g1_i1.p1 TRINITY_DN57145_c0_g1~~TRINITY_DN57145_c0_g1_i1.p1  ORF type:complete len:218 (+),score=34.15 TRINITY_DN57145_c0_g1_i1:183-836(+)